jgi:hypothetical protein
MPQSLAEECRAVLVANVVSTRTFDREALDVLNVIDEDVYNQVRDKADTGGQYGIISGTGNFEEFRDKRAKRFTLNKFTRDSAASLNYLSSQVPDSARAIWLQCIQAAISRSNPGLFLYTEQGKTIPCKIWIGFNSTPGSSVRVVRSAITDGFEKVGNKKSTTLFAKNAVLLSTNKREYLITPSSAQKAVSFMVELADGERRVMEIQPAVTDLAVVDNNTYVVTANQISGSTSTGVTNLNLKEECSADGRVGFVCNSDPTKSTRAVYNLAASTKIPPGKYLLQIEYASSDPIPGVALHVSGLPVQVLDFGATGGPGMSNRKYVDLTVELFDGARDMILDRGAQIPHVRGFIFTKFP